MEPKLIFAVFHLDRPFLETVVEDGDVQRKIHLEWADHSGPNRVPLNWFEQVCGEVKFQRANKQESPLAKFLAGPRFR